MNLSKLVKEVSIDGKEYIMAFDMRSILKYKELSSKTFTQGIQSFVMGDDEEAMYFIASMLREKEKPTELVGEEILSWNVINLLVKLKSIAIDVVIDSLSEDDNSKKKETQAEK